MSKKIEFNKSGSKSEIPQYKLWVIALMFIWPILWFTLLIYGFGPFFVQEDETISTWVVSIISILGNGAELVIALLILKKEGYKLTLSSLKERINWRWPKNWKLWVAFVVVFVAAFGLTAILNSTVAPMARLGDIPEWMPRHPLKEVSTFQEIFPDINFQGNVLFFIIQNIFVILIFNIIGEELYYRAVLQPKMKGVFGNWNWVAAGLGFAVKHLYFWWRVPALVPASLSLAFVFGPVGSLPLSMISHWVANMGPQMLIYTFLAMIGSI